jgi:hypothetical protein
MHTAAKAEKHSETNVAFTSLFLMNCGISISSPNKLQHPPSGGKYTASSADIKSGNPVNSFPS